ncbi:MAG: hypothetical protein M3Y66_04960 [Actinomycetota bacterium]|nr:hypothetical protein [Actinomycetota bacterium]
MNTADATVTTPATLRDWPLPEAGVCKEARGHLLVFGAYLPRPRRERLAAPVGVLGYLAHEIPAQVRKILAEME